MKGENHVENRHQIFRNASDNFIILLGGVRNEGVQANYD